MAKTTKSKEKPIDTELETLHNLNETIKIVQGMQNNMEVLNGNMQGAIDQIQEIQSIVDKMKDRMGL